MAEVPLVDLEVIVRYSLAIRQELAPADEVLAALDESRALVLSLMEGGSGNGSADEAQEEEPGPDQVRDPDQDRDEAPVGRAAVDEPDVAVEEHVETVAGEDADAADLDAEVAAAEDEVFLDDLADSGADVDGTPGLDPEPPPVKRAPLAAGAVRVADVFAADDEDQAWVDEVERIRQRRIRKARQEAEERQARQAELAAEARRAKRAEEAVRAESARRAEEEAGEAVEARRIQQARRAERGLRAGKPRAAEAERPRRQAPPPRSAPAADLDDVLELPPPLPADEAARRREERRRRRTRG